MGQSSSRNGKVAEIEKILGYTFRNKSLLEEAITHGSYAGHPSYQRLEFVGDAVLGLAVSDYLYKMYPDIPPKYLTALRSVNVSNEKLARVAVRLDLYCFLSRNSPDLDREVSEFIVDLVKMEEDKEEEDDGRISYGGSNRQACPVLADMVESIAAAVYWDCDSDLKLVWKIFKEILQPFITLETMEEHPVAALHVICQKQGKTLTFSRPSRLSPPCTVDAMVDGVVMGTGWAKQEKIAKLNAARVALRKISDVDVSFDDDGQNLPKQRLSNYCDKKRWIKPSYKIDKEEGLAHNKKFICSVTVGPEDSRITHCGDQESRVKYAENSAARRMLSILQHPDKGKQPARIPNVQKSPVCSWHFLFFFFLAVLFIRSYPDS